MHVPPESMSTSLAESTVSSRTQLPPAMHLYALQQHSFSDEAAQLLAAQCEEMAVSYCDNINGVWDAVSRGEYGLIPIENSSGGLVWPHLDRLRKEMVRIIGEANLGIRMVAGGLSDASLQRVQRVCSHQKGLDQCSTFITEQLPDAVEHVPLASTAAAAEYVRDAADVRNIVLASRSAIQAAGLRELATNVADLPAEQNITQFLVVHQNQQNDLPYPEGGRHAAIISPHNEPGVLNCILSAVANARADLTSLHSRSVGPKQYDFYVEMRRLGSPRQFELMAAQLENLDAVANVKWLGSWDQSVDSY